MSLAAPTSHLILAASYVLHLWHKQRREGLCVGAVPVCVCLREALYQSAIDCFIHAAASSSGM
jgi:hypothetical protein